MIHYVEGVPIIPLGDPHLGRSFVNGVPLHRRGDREKMVWEDFEKSLRLAREKLVRLHVCMGDLFDRFTVPLEVILRAALAYSAAAASSPETVFVIIGGNHDASRDADRASAFAVFRHLVERHFNIFVVHEEPFELKIDDSWFAFVPWHPFKNAREMVEQLLNKDHGYDAVFGHRDIERFPGSEDNLLPVDLLTKCTRRVFTGHIHQPGVRYDPNHDLEIICTGSMQPYAHGEDVDGKMYVTVSQDELITTLANDPEAFRNCCVRVDVRPGHEALP